MRVTILMIFSMFLFGCEREQPVTREELISRISQLQSEIGKLRTDPSCKYKTIVQPAQYSTVCEHMCEHEHTDNDRISYYDTYRMSNNVMYSNGGVCTAKEISPEKSVDCVVCKSGVHCNWDKAK